MNKKWVGMALRSHPRPKKCKLICVCVSSQAQQVQDKVDEILAMIAQPQHSPGGTPRKAIIEENSVPIFEMQFPELFVYWTP